MQLVSEGLELKIQLLEPPGNRVQDQSHEAHGRTGGQ
jgi:hypothetical protein